MIHEFNPELYPRKVWVVCKHDVEELKTKFRGYTPLGEDYYANVIAVWDKQTNKSGFLIEFSTKRDMYNAGLIAHEATHVALRIFEAIGRENGLFSQQEPLCYLTEWVVNCIVKARNYKNRNDQ